MARPFGHAYTVPPTLPLRPNAVRCLDPFHVIKAATDALDEIRREVWNEARRDGRKQARQGPQGRPVRALEERGQADRPPEDQARRDPANQQAALSRIPHLPAAPRDLPRHLPGSGRAARRMARMGPTMSPGAVRQARQDDHQPASRDRSRDPTRTVERTDRASEHPAPAHHPPRLRIPHPRSPDRARHAQPRRAVPATTHMTPGNSRSFRKVGSPLGLGVTHRWGSAIWMPAQQR